MSSDAARDPVLGAAATRLIVSARFLAVVAGLIAVVALFGYIANAQSLIQVSRGLQAMSPLTALGLIALAASAVSVASVRAGFRIITASFAIVIGLAVLAIHLINGSDIISPRIGTVLFGMPAELVGRTSIATALGFVAIGASLILRPIRAQLADFAGGAALIMSGTAILGYLYGVKELYAVPIFNSMGLNTAIALTCLSLSTLLAQPDQGLAALIASDGIEGNATRKQLAFVSLPILAGWLLMRAVSAAYFGPAVALALLVVVTIVPLTLLILRDGRILHALDKERLEKSAFQENIAAEMERRLIDQADHIEEQNAKRSRAEATMYRAQRMEAVGQLTGGIAHDFNNLLMAISGNLELMQKRLKPGDDHLRRYIIGAVSAVDHGSKVTGQLLAFSRSQRLNIRSVLVEPVLRKAGDLVSSALGPNITLLMDLRLKGAWAMTDPDQLELAILNLAMNARDAMPNGGTLRIESKVMPGPLADGDDQLGHLAIWVIDTGMGMSEETRSKAVEPFFTTKGMGKGTGLGLAQAYGFVRQCHGDLKITSAPEAGTAIELLLPMGVLDEAMASGAQASTEDYGRTFEGKTVLVIDDDHAVRAVIVDALGSAGFDVVEAIDGPSGLALLEKHDPAAAVIDFLMPGMNGAEVARRAQVRRPGLPIVFVSGYSDTVALDGIAGAVILRKPFDLSGLSRALHSVLH